MVESGAVCKITKVNELTKSTVNIIRGMVVAIFLISLMFTPWVCMQSRILKSLTRETFDQNLRMEKKVDNNSRKLDSLLKK